jgi:hypothetical protein
MLQGEKFLPNLGIENIGRHQLTPSVMYGILLLTNSIHLTADIVLSCTKEPVLIHDSHSPFALKDVYSPAGSVPLPSNPTFYTPTKSNL